MKLATRIQSFACLLALLMASLGLAGGSAVAEEGKAWTGEELRTRLVDRTFFFSGGEGNDKWGAYYYLNPDGTSVGKAWGKGWKLRTTGTWKIEGDTICSRWSRPEWGMGCYEYFDKGDYIGSRGISGDKKGMFFLQKDVGQGNVKNLR